MKPFFRCFTLFLTIAVGSASAASAQNVYDRFCRQQPSLCDRFDKQGIDPKTWMSAIDGLMGGPMAASFDRYLESFDPNTIFVFFESIIAAAPKDPHALREFQKFLAPLLKRDKELFRALAELSDDLLKEFVTNLSPDLPGFNAFVTELLAAPLTLHRRLAEHLGALANMRLQIPQFATFLASLSESDWTEFSSKRGRIEEDWMDTYLDYLNSPSACSGQFNDQGS